jgi:quinol monooxygenase YgiN
MKTLGLFLSVFATVGLLLPGIAQAADAKPRMLVHDVYFSLKDNSDAAKERLVEACAKYLSDHPGIVWFDAAVRAKEFDRPVNDQDFDVALHLVFRDKAAHDAYQVAPKHQQFIEESQDNWKQVRVFDSYVAANRRVPPAQ